MNLVITDAARDAIRKYAETENLTDWGIRVGVLPGGCSGFKYDLNIEEKPLSEDVILTINGIALYIDEFSIQYLDGVTIDYVAGLKGTGFTFINPNATSGCGCGSSFSV